MDFSFFFPLRYSEASQYPFLFIHHRIVIQDVKIFHQASAVSNENYKEFPPFEEPIFWNQKPKIYQATNLY